LALAVLYATCLLFPSSSAFFLYRSGDPRVLHSFPTRRSSDLGFVFGVATGGDEVLGREGVVDLDELLGDDRALVEFAVDEVSGRSEEHTSELQSRFDLVCRLLLEKKKKLIIRVRTLWTRPRET